MFPSIWKRANITLIPKVQKPESIDNFRPISLTPTVSKIFESLVGQHLMIEFEEKFDPGQYGARRGRSTTMALIDIVHRFHSALDNGYSVRTLFVDYAKAFDHVSHALILEKMLNIGVDPWILQWLNSFLFNRMQRVRINNFYSSFVSFNGGLPQGSWFGPFMFLVIINDLSTTLPTYKFVDDVTVVETLTSSNGDLMQQACSDLEQWSKENFMTINVKKTCEMVIKGQRRNENEPDPLRIDGRDLLRVSTFKLLGVFIQCNLKWNCHVEYICSKANSRLHFLRSLCRCNIASRDLVKFYCSVIRSVLEYACEVFHSSITTEQSTMIETIQKRALRIIYGYSYSYVDLLTLSGLQRLSERRESLCSKLFNSIVMQNTHCLHHLLPPKREVCAIGVSTRAAFSNPFVLPRFKTERCRNEFINYSLYNFTI